MTPFPTYPDLAGQVVPVTGGATGIGAAHVEAFAATGARVRFLGIQDGPGEALAASLAAQGHDVRFIRCDLLDLPALRGAVDGIGGHDGPVSALVNNAAADDRHDLAAIVGLTSFPARELGPHRIRVNAVAPGNVPTPRQRALWAGPEDEARMQAPRCIPGAIEPRDIAGAAVFLCSEAARMITKQCIVVNAGSL